MAGIIKKQILKHLSRSVGRGAPGRLRRCGAGRLCIPVLESDPLSGRWAGGTGSFCPQKGELKPLRRSDLEAEGVAGCSCAYLAPGPRRRRRGGGSVCLAQEGVTE